MASSNPAAEAETKIEVAQAKAELAVVLTESFREDINGLRHALQHANQRIDALQAENASLRLALSHADPNYAHPEQQQPGPRPEDDAAPAAVVADARVLRADLLQVPPEGTIFSNGGPYMPGKTGERAANNARLKRELNEWTQDRGYSVKIFRSRLEKKRAKLIISCILAGAPKYRAGRQETAEEQQQRKERAQQEGESFRKQRVSRLQNCPLRFSLLEIISGSGTFVVKHTGDPGALKCNHEPSFTGPGSDADN